MVRLRSVEGECRSLAGLPSCEKEEKEEEEEGRVLLSSSEEDRDTPLGRRDAMALSSLSL